MKALLLVGGFGTRLRPITYAVPKQLFPLAGKALLYHVMDMLPSDTEEVVLAAGYKVEELQAYVDTHPARFPTRCVAEAEPLGTGGGLKNASRGISDPFLFLNSDVVTNIDINAMVAFHQAKRAFGTIAMSAVQDTRPYGVAGFDTDDRITRFVEKPEPSDAPSQWINAGIAIWDRAVLDRIPSGRAVSFEREVIPTVLSRGVYGFKWTGYWEDAGTPARVLRSQQLLFDDHRGTGSSLPRGSKGRGPVAAASDVRAQGAKFGPYVTLDSGVRVDAGAYVENSILMAGAHVGPEARVIGTIVGPGIRVERGRHVEKVVLGASPAP